MILEARYSGGMDTIVNTNKCGSKAGAESD